MFGSPQARVGFLIRDRVTRLNVGALQTAPIWSQ